ncbi:MAG: c-type cytochrome [Burkholderiales bacterium]
MIRLGFFIAALLCGADVFGATPADLYADHCARCHAAGDAGAPKVGDRAEWARRIGPGIARMYRSARGHSQHADGCERRIPRVVRHRH